MTVLTLIGPKVSCDAAHDQPCYGDNCAHWEHLSITLPAGSQYVATHYFTNADTPNDLSDVRETGPGEVAYAHFSESQVASNASNEPVVSSIYFNRASRVRLVQLTVDYQMP